MSDNIQTKIERIVDIFKKDIKENAECSYLYNYFKPNSSSETKGDESSEEANNSDNKNTGMDKKIHKKTQDFLSTNKLGKTTSISAKMLLELCNYNEKCRTSVVEVFSSSIDIDKDIKDLEKLLKKTKKDALFPIKIEVNTGTTLYIRYREKWDKIGVEYILFSPYVSEIADADSHDATSRDVISEYQVFRNYNDAKKNFNACLLALEADYEGLNEFRLSEKFQKQYGKFMTQKSVDRIVDEYSEKNVTDFEHQI